MVKIKPFLMLLLVFCILLVGCLANSQQTSSREIRPEMVTTTKSKADLAIAVLSETGISKRYDLYLGNSVEIAVPPTRNNKFMDWMQALFVREAGWNYIEAKYVAQLEETFSETELRELLALAKQSLIRRLVQAEIEAYSASAEKRRRLLSTLWDKYNSGVFNPPPEVRQ
ncbi:MAG: hypothetical protein KME21_21165 [Desmonostoc vinosum HA7617-LM4]|jgi:flagellar motor component MotA|nr:hypothetical protein [Desmonostoc vinosum HA7617-LM4]